MSERVVSMANRCQRCLARVGTHVETGDVLSCATCCQCPPLLMVPAPTCRCGAHMECRQVKFECRVCRHTRLDVFGLETPGSVVWKKDPETGQWHVESVSS